ncbi:MAG: winged helix-turn-helix transcriptional regulator [Coprococcus sp.]|nr:winged helix-turn-helix transcriptional regulator [Coprococcus sp.]
MFKYSKFYFGRAPQFIEGDVFRIIVPLTEGNKEESATQSPPQFPTQSTNQSTIQSLGLNKNDLVERIIKLIEQEPCISQKQMAEKLHLNQNTLKYYIKKMRKKGLLKGTVLTEKGNG